MGNRGLQVCMIVLMDELTRSHTKGALLSRFNCALMYHAQTYVDQIR